MPISSTHHPSHSDVYSTVPTPTPTPSTPTRGTAGCLGGVAHHRCVWGIAHPNNPLWTFFAGLWTRTPQKRNEPNEPNLATGPARQERTPPPQRTTVPLEKRAPRAPIPGTSTSRVRKTWASDGVRGWNRQAGPGHPRCSSRCRAQVGRNKSWPGATPRARAVFGIFVEHSLRHLFYSMRVSGTSLQDTFAAHFAKIFCRRLLWNSFVGHSCPTQSETTFCCVLFLQSSKDFKDSNYGSLTLGLSAARTSLFALEEGMSSLARAVPLPI